MHVGVSLVGLAIRHDAHRRTRSGRPSHAAVMRGAELLQRRQVRFTMIAVLTEQGLEHADALFSFFAEHGIRNLGFNMEETEGVNRHSSLERPGVESRYRAFLEQFWRRCMEEPGQVVLREFEGVTSLACSGQRLSHTDMNQPFVIVNVDAHGNLSSFDPELLSVKTERFGDFVFGNVLHDNPERISTSAKFRQVRDEIAAGVEACCVACAYFGLCGGGAGSNKYWEHGRCDGSETQHCRYRIQLVADVLLDGMERQLGLARGDGVGEGMPDVQSPAFESDRFGS